MADAAAVVAAVVVAAVVVAAAAGGGGEAAAAFLDWPCLGMIPGGGFAALRNSTFLRGLQSLVPAHSPTDLNVYIHVHIHVHMYIYTCTCTCTHNKLNKQLCMKTNDF